MSDCECIYVTVNVYNLVYDIIRVDSKNKYKINSKCLHSLQLSCHAPMFRVEHCNCVLATHIICMP